LFIPRGKEHISEVLGGLYGAIEGAVVVFTLVLPMVGVFDILDSMNYF
jgi:hypothetical protein